ncbi:unnamed protein product [Kuraishia capsulata CBS 1993]|uniref:GDP-Man:Man(3)GlcNAc(2)-PP-Dol alpha-1,2-mannosyltransferase n=1 Tax=Kuraishia capsulata CBS 1993 TaxID=1382522 RepID=W6MIP8_9ASCO|nr:uncharacterized protein KUCA_T00001982001 [Kuraishia capsulata CBS 1993]CDK26011.1 unnamed protein product [Kuraishia capsulata CBS 1993]
MATGQTIQVTLLFVVFFIVVTLYRSLTVVLPRYFYVPFNGWKKHVQAAVEKASKLDKPCVLPRSKFATRFGTIRRRLVLASKEPILYSTVPLNTHKDTASGDIKYSQVLRIPQVDRIPETRASEFLLDVNPKVPTDESRKKIFGFFHPYSDASGGGERVLWEAVRDTLAKSEKNIAAVYTFTLSDNTSVSSILASVKSNFGLDFTEYEKNLIFLQLPNTKRWVIDGSKWKHFTLIAQSLASVYVSILAVSALPPDVWVDTMGFPFTYTWISFCLKVPVVSYVHYPLISSDMLGKLNTASLIGSLKYVYWTAILWIYAVAGSYCDIVLCNSTWTKNHISKVWSFNTSAPVICYPPIGSKVNSGGTREKVIVCIAQFRPEKRHSLILEEFSKYLKKTDSLTPYKLVLVGSVRDDNDKQAVEDLKKLAAKYQISHLVELRLNVKHSELQQLLASAEVGLNAMWNEHFGITVVEYLFNGLVPVVHASAGPKLDICVPWNGEELPINEATDSNATGIFFTSEDDPDYAKINNGVTLSDALVLAETMDPTTRDAMLQRERELALAKFGETAFRSKWNDVIDASLAIEQVKRSSRGDVEKVY